MVLKQLSLCIIVEIKTVLEAKFSPMLVSICTQARSAVAIRNAATTEVGHSDRWSNILTSSNFYCAKSTVNLNILIVKHQIA